MATNRSRLVACVVVLLMLTAGAPSARQSVYMASPPPGPRTAMIAGQVVDTSGTPIPDAVVRLNLPKYDPRLATTPQGRVLTDGQGRYFFADLPAGDYAVGASKDGYLGGTYGLQRVGGDTQHVLVAEGERRTDAKLTLWKVAAIGGTVTDEAGEPVVGVTVSALAKTVLAGRVRFGPGPLLPYLVPTTTTDDRGAFRLSVPPGTYVVVVPSTEITVPVSVLNASSQDRSLTTKFFSAGISEVAPIGSPHTQQFGDVAVITPNRGMTPPAISPTGRMEAYRTTYFPSAATASAATQITLTDGQERGDVAIAMHPVPAARVSGRITMADGTVPPPMGIHLVGSASADVAEEGYETAIGLSDTQGRFTLMGVPAGEYVLKNPDRVILAAGQRGEPSWFVSQRVSVGTTDIPDLAVTAKPSLHVEGRIAIAGAPEARDVPPTLAREFVYLEPPFGETIHMLALIGPGFSFATSAASGRYVVTAPETGGWFLTSVTLDGKDITERVIDLQSDVTSLVVTFTDKPARISGVVHDAHGAPVTTASVVAFPVDPTRRAGHGPEPRDLRSAATSRTGAYVLGSLPPGDYFVIAIDGATADGWQDPARLEALSREATRLTVAGEPKTLDLTLKEIK